MLTDVVELTEALSAGDWRVLDIAVESVTPDADRQVGLDVERMCAQFAAYDVVTWERLRGSLLWIDFGSPHIAALLEALVSEVDARRLANPKEDE